MPAPSWAIFNSGHTVEHWSWAQKKRWALVLNAKKNASCSQRFHWKQLKKYAVRRRNALVDTAFIQESWSNIHFYSALVEYFRNEMLTSVVLRVCCVQYIDWSERILQKGRFYRLFWEVMNRLRIAETIILQYTWQAFCMTLKYALTLSLSCSWYLWLSLFWNFWKIILSRHWVLPIIPPVGLYSHYNLATASSFYSC